MNSHTTLEEIMRPAVTISEDATLREAVERMNKEKTNELLVIDMDGMLAGEVSVTDLLAAVVPDTLDGDEVVNHFANEETIAEAIRNAADKPVSECMSYSVESVRADARLIDVAAVAISMGQARIPVVDHDGHPVGIISRIGLKHILSTYLGVDE